MDNKKKIKEMVMKLACAKCGALTWECLGSNSPSCYHNEAIKEKVDLFNKIYDVNFEFRNYIDNIITNFEEIDKHYGIEKMKEKYGEKYIEKREEIEDLKIDISDILEINHEDERFLFTLHTRNVLAEELVDKGYGNIKEAVKEFAEKLKQSLINKYQSLNVVAHNSFLALPTIIVAINEVEQELYGEEESK